MHKLLEKVKENLADIIKPILKKGDAMTPADLEILTKAVCTIEKIKRIEDSDCDYDDFSYSRARNPMTGRYLSHNDSVTSHRYYDGAFHHGYSGHSIKDRMIDQLERMVDEAQSDYERKLIKEEIRHLRD